VQLTSFFLGQMPITQAHWRTVAQWEPWGKALTPNPSFFPNQREQSMQKRLLGKVADALVDRAPSSATPTLDHGYEGYEGAPEDGNAWFVQGQSKDEGSSR
jgi:formylglycine-generating enzyme required for sulfatase activity